MEQKIFKFPSIEQLRNVIQQVAHKARYRGDDENGQPIYEDCPLPTLDFIGTVKLHGTNASVIYVWNPLTFEYEFYTQSRENIITPERDNAGFAAFMYTSDTDALLAKIMKAVSDDAGYTPEVIRVYGEWCGGNIQKGVAINGLDKMFVIFAIKLDNKWLTNAELVSIKIPEKKIYNILDYDNYQISIDFNNPQLAVDEISKMITEVEKECPVGKAFGKNGIGEGIVFKCVTEGWTESRYWFKAKGDEHKASKTKEKVPINVERVNNMKELVNNLVTESRLLQGLDHLREEQLTIDRKNLGKFLQWIYKDIVKEELDTIMANGFEPKEISGAVSNKAREWFFDYELKQVGLTNNN